jgi:hypothetical protein
MRKKTAGLAAIICAAGLISVTQTDTVLADGGFSYEDVANREFLFAVGPVRGQRFLQSMRMELLRDIIMTQI